MIKELIMEKTSLRDVWISEKFSNCIKLKSGDGLTAKKMIAGSFPVFGGNGIAGYHNDFNLSGEHIIIGRVGALCGNARYIDKKIWLTDNAFKISEFKFDFDLKFLNYLLNHIELRNYARQAAQPVISNSSLKDVTLSFPKSVKQQKQIVAILDKAFATIATAKANAAQNLQNAKELFESYLQNVFENKGDDWEEYELSEIVDKRCSLSYGIVQPGDEFPNGLPVIRPTNMKNKFVYPLGLKLIDPTKAESYKRTSLIGDELLLCVRGETGVTSLITDELKGANVTRGIVPICFDSDKLSLPFGYYLFISPFVQKQIKDKTYGAALMQINIRDVRKLIMRIPSIKEQQQIVKKLNSLSSETKKLEAIYTQKITDLKEMKKSVLQKAFSGQLNTVN